jgi:hypothetical protein
MEGGDPAPPAAQQGADRAPLLELAQQGFDAAVLTFAPRGATDAMIGFGLFAAACMGYTSLARFLEDHSGMGPQRLHPQKELSKRFRAYFGQARAAAERRFSTQMEGRFFRHVQPEQAYAYVTLLRKLFFKCRQDNPGLDVLLAWADDNVLNDFRVWLQRNIIEVLGRDAIDTWDNLSSLVEHYFGRAERIPRPNLQVVMPQAQPQPRRRRNEGQGGGRRQRARLAGDEAATEPEGLPVPPADNQDPEEEEARPDTEALATWRDYLSPAYWMRK